MKVVLDTNIWISGLLLPKSIAGQVLSSWRHAMFDVIISQPILDEIKKVLLYPKIQKRIKWDEEKIEQYLQLLKFFAAFISFEPNQIITVERDLKDSAILTTYVLSKADHLVTGDNDLLALKNSYSILSLTEFYNLVM